MHTLDHSSTWPQEPGDGDALRMFESILVQENEQQEVIHQLTHQGMDEAIAGHIERAEDIFSRALALAREHHYPRWEAQVLYYAGVVFKRSGKPERALPYVEQALSLFQEHGPLLMVASAGILLASLFHEAGRPKEALPLLDQVMQMVMAGAETGQISVAEGQYHFFSVFHEMGHIYRTLQFYPQAVETFEMALDLARSVQSDQDTHAILADLINLSIESGDLDRAIELGESALAETDGFQPHNLTFLTNVTFDLGHAYVLKKVYELSLDRSQAAYAYFKRDRATCQPNVLHPGDDTAFLGKLLVNMGTAYNGLGDLAREADFYPMAVACWRLGEELLAQAEHPNVEVPRRNLRLVQQAYPDRATYDLLLRLSEPLFLDLRAELANSLAAERDERMKQGRQALVRKQYAEAATHFLSAMQRDPFDLCPGRHWHAYTRLFSCHWEKDLVEIAECFELDSQGAREVAAGSLLFAEWSKMGQHPTASNYLAATRKAFALAPEEDPIDRLERLAHRHASRPEVSIYAAMMQYLRGNNEECLKLLEADTPDVSQSAWCRTFWRAVVFATDGQEEQARILIGEALRNGMPPVLLGPLRWLKASNAAPISFFMLVVRPLFISYALPYGEKRVYHTDEDSKLPSRVRKIKTIRQGLCSTEPMPGDAEYQNHHLLDLACVRGPGGEAHLVYVEFDAAENEQGETELWPTTFAVRYPTARGEVARRWQEYWINYAPGREQVTLVDRDFQVMTLPLEPVGVDYEDGGWTRGGYYWANPGPGLQVKELGTPTRFERLPCGTLAYLRRLLDEAVPHLEIFCEACSQQTKRVGDVWCQHIFWCRTCQHISSPVERSRKMMGRGPHYCPHLFPIEEG